MLNHIYVTFVKNLQQLTVQVARVKWRNIDEKKISNASRAVAYIYDASCRLCKRCRDRDS